MSNLKARFPQLSEEAIRKALKDSGGHAGLAGKALDKVALSREQSRNPGSVRIPVKPAAAGATRWSSKSTSVDTYLT